MWSIDQRARLDMIICRSTHNGHGKGNRICNNAGGPPNPQPHHSIHPTQFDTPSHPPTQYLTCSFDRSFRLSSSAAAAASLSVVEASARPRRVTAAAADKGVGGRKAAAGAAAAARATSAMIARICFAAAVVVWLGARRDGGQTDGSKREWGMMMHGSLGLRGSGSGVVGAR